MINWADISGEHGPLVWRTAYRLLGSDADTADCFQETFLSALAVSQRQQVKNWPGLLVRLATARALDALRRRKRETLGFYDHPDLAQLASINNGPSSHAEEHELMDQLRFALSQIPPQQSEVFCLRHLNDLTYEQIAEQLEISVDLVGVTLHRARARLRELLISAARADQKR